MLVLVELGLEISFIARVGVILAILALLGGLGSWYVLASVDWSMLLEGGLWVRSATVTNTSFSLGVDVPVAIRTVMMTSGTMLNIYARVLGMGFVV